MINDLRFAFRQLTKSPGFAAVAILTLAIGIGACIAMFSIIHAVLLKPLPFREPDRLVWIENGGEGGLSARTSRTDVLRAWQEQNESFESIAAYFAFFDYGRQTITGSGEPERVRAVGISDNFIDSLGIQLPYGRNFTVEECASLESPPATILSYAFWQSRFAGDPEIVGTTINLNNRPTTIVGVLGPQFDFDATFSPGTEIALITPFPLNEQTARWGNTVFGIGRLKPGVTIEEARTEFSVITPRIVEQLDFGYGGSFKMKAIDDALRGQFRMPFFVLTGAVAFVLAIACLNLSNLLLARINNRRQEFAVRAALGARRRHLVQQTITESLILAVAGSLVGVPLAVWATSALARLQTFGVPLLQDAAVNPAALAVTIGLTLLAGLACGVPPALQLAFAQNGSTSQIATHQRSAGRASVFARNGLIVIEVALACMLLVGAGLLLRSFNALLQVELGFQPQNTMAWRIDSSRSFNSTAEANQYYDELVRTVATIPGVEEVGLSDTLPLGRNRTWGAGATGVEYPPGEYPIAFPRVVDSNYLQAMQIPLIAGRFFDGRDSTDAEKAIIINESLARRLWPDQDPIGRQINVNGQSTVIGVVGNVRHGSLEEQGSNEMYLNYRQTGDWFALEMVVRSSRPVESLIPDVRRAIASYDPSLPSGEFYPLENLVDNAVGPRRLITQLLGLFSTVALILAALGLYGVIAYSVVQRTQEIGIRMAIGAQRQDVLQLILRGGLKLVALGVVLGLVGAFALTRVLQSLLFGVTAHDPLVFATNAALLFAVAIAACLFPALRATRVDPVVALRAE